MNLYSPLFLAAEDAEHAAEETSGIDLLLPRDVNEIIVGVIAFVVVEALKSLARGGVVAINGNKYDLLHKGVIRAKRPFELAARILQFDAEPREAIPDWVGPDAGSDTRRRPRRRQPPGPASFPCPGPVAYACLSGPALNG